MSLEKKIFIISGALFLMLLFLWGIYKVAFEKKPTTVATQKTVSEKPTSSSQTPATSTTTPIETTETPKGRIYALGFAGRTFIYN